MARQKFGLQITEAALDHLADAGYDPQFGARPMKRALQDILVNELSKQVLAGEFAAGDTVYVDVKDGHLTFGKKEVKSAAEVAEWRTRLKPKATSSAPSTTPKRRRSKKEKTLGELKKATKDVEDAVEEVKKK